MSEVFERAAERMGLEEERGRRSEPPMEKMTARVPSDTFIWLAGGSIAASLLLKMAGRDHQALFVGQWAPTFLLLGVYNKLVNQSRHPRHGNGM